jgi:hypothetical protein
MGLRVAESVIYKLSNYFFRVLVDETQGLAFGADDGLRRTALLTLLFLFNYINKY